MSKTQKIWIKKNSSSKKQIKYSFKYVLLIFQPTKIQIKIKNVVNSIKNNEIPSIPI